MSVRNIFSFIAMFAGLSFGLIGVRATIGRPLEIGDAFIFGALCAAGLEIGMIVVAKRQSRLQARHLEN